MPGAVVKSTVVADGFLGNDLVVRHDGHIYVTHPGWDGKEPSKIWHITPTGEKTVVDTGLKFSNGICFGWAGVGGMVCSLARW